MPAQAAVVPAGSGPSGSSFGFTAAPPPGVAAVPTPPNSVPSSLKAPGSAGAPPRQLFVPDLIAALANTVFKGETLRAMLLNAYGWWKVSQILFIAAIASFALGGLALLASLFGLTLRHHPDIIHEAIEGTPVTHA